MTRENELSLRSVAVSSCVWYLTVAAGWGLIALALVRVFQTPRIEHAPAFVMTAALGILLELLPLVQGRGHDPQGVVMSTAFVFATMFVWGPWPAVIIVAIGAVMSDLRAGKIWWKVIFNPAQYALSLGGAAAAWYLFGTDHSLAHPLGRLSPWIALPMIAAAIVYFVANISFVAGVMTYAGTFAESFFEDFWHNALMTFAVISLSPLVVIVGQACWPLLPLLLIPLLLLYYTAQLAVEREHAAGHDALTGLPNRATLQFELAHAFAAHARTNEPFALMLLDLNDFKRVNDTLGHQFGDALLVELARRVQADLRLGDTVARLGGDEFAILVFDVDEAGALEVGHRIRRTMSESVTIDNVTLEINLSLGIAMCPHHGIDGTTLLRRADVAMYTAKGRTSGVELYSSERDENSADHLELLGALRQALADDDLQLHFQPKVATDNSATLGVEALVRWNHPTRGAIPPDAFIPLAERSGIMPLLTARVIELALTQCAEWCAAGLSVPIAVNISPTDLIGDALPDLVARLLSCHDLEPGMLLLEITERLGTNQIEEATRTLVRLRELGVRISLDDFGTGYSSLLRLSMLPVDEIKIDRIFVSAMTGGNTAVSIVRALIDLAHALGVPAIAEGVETAQEWQLLSGLGCDGVQGWHAARPMASDAATAWISARTELDTLSVLAG